MTQVLFLVCGNWASFTRYVLYLALRNLAILLLGYYATRHIWYDATLLYIYIFGHYAASPFFLTWVLCNPLGFLFGYYATLAILFAMLLFDNMQLGMQMGTMQPLPQFFAMPLLGTMQPGMLTSWLILGTMQPHYVFLKTLCDPFSSRGYDASYYT